LLVTVDASGKAQPEFKPLDVFRWAEVTVHAETVATIADAVDNAAKAIDDARQEADARPVAVRIRMACADELYRQVAEDLEQFRFELAARAGDQVWVEKIKLEQVGETREVAPAITGDATSELRVTLSDLRSDAEATKAIFAAGDCGKLRKMLPPDFRGIFSGDNDGDIFDVAALLLTSGALEDAE
jgi:hypothetical protein